MMQLLLLFILFWYDAAFATIYFTASLNRLAPTEPVFLNVLWSPGVPLTLALLNLLKGKV